MDEGTADLIAQLCTRIGMIMEDTSAIALATSRLSRRDLQAKIAAIDTAACQISALVAAASTLAR